jgi:hypothetical protein
MDALYWIVQVDPHEPKRAPPRTAIILVEDVLVSGEHFKCVSAGCTKLWAS